MNLSVMHHRWIRYAAFVAGWALLGLVLTAELYFNLRAGGHMMPVSFTEVAVGQFGRTVLWAMLAPLILWMRKKVPLGCGRGWGGLTHQARCRKCGAPF